ncbi:MAG: flagellar hook-associated protein FlgK [Arcobacter sp.]|nr:flagellar hook-associated protein FlgK [Arcobacter sp.]
MMDSLYTAKSGLSVARSAVDVTSNNIANENTEAYKKRTVDVSEISSLEDNIGNGVSFDGVTRTTNEYLYTQLTQQNSLMEYYNQEDLTSSNIETMFSETDSSGLSITISDFFNDLESLRSDPNSSIYQEQLESQSETLVNNLSSLYEELDEIETSTYSLLEDQVSSVNSILEEIVYLNEKIVKSSSSSNNDLLDKRDALEEELSKYVDFKIDTSSSKYNLEIAGVSAIFNNTNLHEVSINETYTAQKDIYISTSLEDSNINSSDEITLTLNNTTSITITANPDLTSDDYDFKNQIVDEINNNSEFNELSAYLDTSNNLIITSTKEGEESKFDLAITINDVEIQKNDNSIQGKDEVFLSIYNEELSLESGSIKSLTNNLSTSTSIISSYKSSLDDFANALVSEFNKNSSTSVFTGSSISTLSFVQNSIGSLSSDDLESLAQIQWSDEINIDSNSDDTTSFSQFYQNLLVSVSSHVESNNFRLDSQKSIVNSLESTYNELTKVDTDEEMVNLLQYQAAYEANAKIITAVDEMLQTLLNM